MGTTDFSRERRRRAFRKYFLLELPGWAIAGAVLYALYMTEWVTQATAIGLWCLWVAKDFALYPLLRTAYEDSNPDATAALVDAVGVAIERLAPEGYVRIGSESWHASVVPREEAIEAGCQVRVVEVRNLTLRVTRFTPTHSD